MIKRTLFNSKVEVVISELEDGNMRFFDSENEEEIIDSQSKLGREVGLTGEQIARVRTVYGDRNDFTNYQEITHDNLSSYVIRVSEQQILVSDGLATKCADAGILLPLADCLGAVVYDEKLGVLGLLHSGRQNLEQNGAQKFVDFLVCKFGSDPKDLKIYFSPYALDYKIFKLDNKSLSAAATEQFLAAGVLVKNIIDPKINTVASDNLPSYSHGDTNKRFAILARIK